jgi:uncharacterized membrane protein
MTVTHATEPRARSASVPADRFLLGGLVALMGVLHFTHTSSFSSIVPEYLPAPDVLVWLSGVAEVALGVGLLMPSTRVLAAYGLIALFVAVYPANISMAMHPERAIAGIPEAFQPTPLMLWLRLPLQFLFIAWAYRHARLER